MSKTLHPLMVDPKKEYDKNYRAWLEVMKTREFSFKTKSELLIMPKVIEQFCLEFINQVDELKVVYKSIGLDISKSLPFPFNNETVSSYGGYFSVDRRHILLIFGESEADSGFFYRSMIGNPCHYLAPGVDIQNLQMEIPLNVDFEITYPNQKSIKMKYYSLLLSSNMLIANLKNIKQFTRDFVSVHWGRYIYEDTKPENEIDSYLTYLEKTKQRMAELIFNESTGELVIDKFLEDNPVILNRALNLETPMKMTLKNILEKYEHDLKPDLIAYDPSDKSWAIIDYKKSKPTIIKNFDKVRTGFRADVHALEDQLRDYVEYFDEAQHRDYVEKKYRIEIEHPKAIGIIGNVRKEEQIAFTRLMKAKPRYFNVIPYNYLFENFTRHVSLAEQILKKQL